MSENDNLGPTLKAILDGSLSEAQGLERLRAERHASVLGRLAARVGGAPSVQVASDDALEGEPVGRYLDARELGRGGMGLVLKARDPDLNRTVAIKLALPGKASPEDLRKFLVEAQVTGQLEHPGIVPVHELGMIDGEPYFSMKLVKGQTLGEILAGLRDGDRRTLRRFTLARLLRCFVQVCDAIAFAHVRGVIHRDLKPDNIMVGEYGEVLVMDWGLARVDRADDLQAAAVAPDRQAAGGDHLRTMDGTIMGTPAYMPPEQAEGNVRAIGPVSDVYSLGAILYELLSWAPPFEGKNVWDVLARVTEGELISPSRRAPEREIPRELEAIVLRAMATARADRYRTVEALRGDVEAYLDGRLVSAAAYSGWQLASKWLARNRGLVAAAALVALVVGGFLVMRQLEASERAAQRQREAKQRADAAAEQAAQAEREELDRVDAMRAAIEAGEAARRKLDPGQPPADGVASPAQLEARHAWFDASGELVAQLERLAAHTPAPETEAVLARIDRPGLAERRRAVCRECWQAAQRLGLWPLARSWIGRAVGAGLSPRERKRALDGLDDARLARQRAALVACRERLDEAAVRTLNWRPDQWRSRTVDFLLQRAGPELVKLLLAPEQLDSLDPNRALLAIETLGRIGDASTVGPEGETASQALARRLVAADWKHELMRIDALALALRRLKDPGVYLQLHGALEGAELGSHRRNALLTALRESALPAELEDGGRLAPKTAADYVRRATLYSAGESREKALADLDRALALDPDHAEAALRRAKLLNDIKDPRATAAWDRAFELDPTVDVQLMRAIHTQEVRRRWPAALAELNAILARDPDNAKALMHKGWILRDMGRLPEAKTALDRSIALAPRKAEAYLQRGRLWLAQRRYREAIADFGSHLELDVSGVPSYCYLYRAMAYEAIKDPAAALADYDRCLSLNGSHPSAFMRRGALLASLGKEQRAIADLERALRGQPRMWQAAYQLAMVHARAKRTEQAREALRRAIEHAPQPQADQLRRLLDQLR